MASLDDDESPRARLVSLPMWVYRHRVPILAGFGGMLLAGVIALGYFTTRVVARFDGRRWNLPSRIYSDLYALRPGDAASIPAIAAKLGRLYYQETDGPPERPGHYRREKDALEIFTRGFRYPGRTFPGARLRVVFAAGRVKSLVDAAGEPVPALILEPELLGSVFGAELEDRTVIRLAEAPPSLIDAILVTEDRDFFRHTGVSVRRLFGAVFRTLTGGMKQGGSTLTQQLVKNLYLSPERTLRRKATEAVMAVVLDARYSKEEILEAYLNEIYLGRRGAIAVTGVGEAARHYFGVEVADLDLAQSATLAGMIRAPNAYSPFRNPERTRQRRDLVLRLMREEGKIDEAAMKAAMDEPITPRSRVEDLTRAPHFVDFVKGELAERYGKQLQTEGLQIYTTLDVDLQQAGQRAVTQGLENLEKTYKRLASASRQAPLQGALIVLEPQTGGVRALVGARDYRLSQFNRVTQAHRQPGSLFKPFVYLAAFARRDMDPPVTPATILMDTPITVEWGQKTDEESWTPRNYDGDYRGPMSARQALERSINIPTVRVSLMAGLPYVLGAAKGAGIESRLRGYPSVALGAFEISPMEIAGAYSVFANSGVRVAPNAIVGVTTGDGTVLDRKAAPLSPALPADAVYLVNTILKGAVDHGTGTGARAKGLTGVLAGKTGTTNDGRDAWFVGFSPRFLAVVWVGYDDNRGLNLSGTQAAVPIFADFSRAAPAQFFVEDFPVPSDIVTATIDPSTGFLASPGCPQPTTEVFIEGTAPTTVCPKHQ
ncbi:MAG TPA: PBP1A family penicillin-binding protein [Thermoanaerobaculia bacterium]|nr:PBP1A family penicillin-binding protein [Thermoanaerobaculia bacterium]